MNAQIHFFTCSWCKSTATCTVLAEDTHIDCPLCHRWMAHKFSYAVQTDEDRALAARGLVLNRHIADNPFRLRPCTQCKKRVPAHGMIDLSAAGTFCSAGCADAGVAKHEAYMTRRATKDADELAALEEKFRPKPTRAQMKESA